MPVGIKGYSSTNRRTNWQQATVKGKSESILTHIEYLSDSNTALCTPLLYPGYYLYAAYNRKYFMIARGQHLTENQESNVLFNSEMAGCDLLREAVRMWTAQRVGR
jgi:hypothetical protein